MTSADIDNALSGDDDDNDDKDGGGGGPLPPTTTTGSDRHVAFAEQELTGSGGDLPALDDVQRSCFERGAPERQTLPAFGVSDRVFGLRFRREMRTSTPPARNAEQRQQRPRSKSVGRTATPKKDTSTTSPSSGVPDGFGVPVAASTPKSAAKQSAAVSSSKSPSDHEAVRGERLSNYGQGSLLVGRRVCPPVPPNAPITHGFDGSSRLLCGRRSVDSSMTRNVSTKPCGQDSVGELGTGDFGSPYGYVPARRRCITPVNESTLSETSSLFNGYQLRRPQLPSTPTSAMSDSETASYYGSASGRRSLPRTGNGCVLPHGYPPAFYHPDSSRVPPQSAAASFAGGSPHWPPPAPCSANTRPQSSTASTMSGSADNIRKDFFDCILLLIF